MRLGNVYISDAYTEKDLSKAEKYFQEMKKVAVNENWKREQAEALVCMSKVFLKRNKKEKAINHLKRAAKIYEEINLKPALRETKHKIKQVSG